jgi:uncharacterized membrane protein YecN with MAPEG domain
MGIATLPITLVTAGGAALIALWLAIRTGMVRRAAGVSIGDGDNERLRARMRAQANYGESAPFILILIAVIEASQGPSLWLWLASVAFLLARVAHPFGMDGVRWCRAGGILVTFLLLFGLGLYAVLTPLGVTTHSRPAIETMPPQG